MMRHSSEEDGGNADHGDDDVQLPRASVAPVNVENLAPDPTRGRGAAGSQEQQRAGKLRKSCRPVEVRDAGGHTGEGPPDGEAVEHRGRVDDQQVARSYTQGG